MNLIFALLLIVLGGLAILYGGADDSPGAQGLGVLGALSGLWHIYATLKNK